MKSEKFDDFIDRQIKKAQEEGTFDNLSGKGKPLTHLDSDPLNGVLQAQGFTARWVELDHEIRQKVEIAEQAVKQTYEWVMQTWSSGSASRQFAQDEWRKARRIFRERIAEINELIKTYNLQVPPTIGQKFLLKEEEELRQLGLTMEIEM
ncbi:MAG: DnaJ family domain-containing protein [Anaerolineae bacterium]